MNQASCFSLIIFTTLPLPEGRNNAMLFKIWVPYAGLRTTRGRPFCDEKRHACNTLRSKVPVNLLLTYTCKSRHSEFVLYIYIFIFLQTCYFYILYLVKQTLSMWIWKVFMLWLADLSSSTKSSPDFFMKKSTVPHLKLWSSSGQT
jgi:hypothetical protein